MQHLLMVISAFSFVLAIWFLTISSNNIKTLHRPHIITTTPKEPATNHLSESNNLKSLPLPSGITHAPVFTISDFVDVEEDLSIKTDIKTTGAVVYLLDDWRARRTYFRGGPKRVCWFNKSMDGLQKHWRPTNPYPVVLLRTGLWNEEDIAIIRKKWPEMSFRFEDVSSIFNVHTEKDVFEDHRDPLDPLNYKRMCQFFFSGLFNVTSLKQYQYLMRLDEDTCIMSDVDYDIFGEFKEKKVSYGYYALMRDPEFVTKGLYDHVRSFVKRHGLRYANPELTMYLRRNGRNDSVPAFASHFEVIDARRYRRKDIKRFVSSVVSSDMIFHRRWGDAPLRFVLSQLFWGPREVYLLNDITILHWSAAGNRSNSRTLENPLMDAMHVMYPPKKGSRWWKT